MESNTNGGGDLSSWNATNSELKPSRLLFRAAPPPRSAIDRFLQGQSNNRRPIGERRVGSNNGGGESALNLGFCGREEEGSVFSGNPTVFGDLDYSSYQLLGEQPEGQQIFNTGCGGGGGDGGYVMMNSIDVQTLVNSSRSSSRVGRPRKPRPAGVNVVKGQWSEEEDRTLIRLVKRLGETNWSKIAQAMEDRSGKQCRERWYNHLRPNIKKDSWSQQEERQFVEAHQKYGNKWAYIAAKIRGRTENSIKNHWYATVRKLHTKRRALSSAAPNFGASILEDYIRNNSLHARSATTPTATNTSIFSLSTVDGGGFTDESDQQHYTSPLLPELTDQGFFNNAGHHEEIKFMQNLCGAGVSDDHQYFTNTVDLPLQYSTMDYSSIPNTTTTDLSLSPIPMMNDITGTLQHIVFGANLTSSHNPSDEQNINPPISLIPDPTQTSEFFIEEPPMVAAHHHLISRNSPTASTYYYDHDPNDYQLAAADSANGSSLLPDTYFPPLLNELDLSSCYNLHQAADYSLTTNHHQLQYMMSYNDAADNQFNYSPHGDMAAASSTGYNYFLDAPLGSACQLT